LGLTYCPACLQQFFISKFVEEIEEEKQAEDWSNNVNEIYGMIYPI